MKRLRSHSSSPHWMTAGIAALGFWAQESLTYAACGGTVQTWDGSSSTSWNAAANWTSSVPNTTTEDALIAAGARNTNADTTTTIGCLEIEGGTMNGTTNGITLSIAGDYFRNLTSGSMNITSGRTWKIRMAGSAAQTFENVDTLNYLVIANNTSVTLTEPFTLRNQLDLSAMTGGTVTIADNVTIDSTSSLNFTIPSGVTLEIASGGSLRFLAASGGARSIVVNGTLKVNGGGSLVLANGNTLQVSSGGTLRLEGSSGSIARLESDGAGTSFIFTVAGQFIGDYFKISRPNASGMNVTGTISSLDNGEFHYLAANGYAITLGASAVFPSTMTHLGFFNDSAGANVRNLNASAYTGGLSTTISEWSGDVGGEASDNDSASCGSDPPGCVVWDTQAAVNLSLNNNSPASSPPSTISQSSADTLFGVFAFGLNQSATATDITGVTLTMSGTATGADISSAKIYTDAGGGTNCVYDAGVDTLQASTTILTGSPPTFTFTLPSGAVTTSGITPACFHVVVATSSIAQTNKTLQFKIASTTDVSNSQNYSFSSTSGPPVSADSSRITGGTTRDWRGTSNTNWNTTGNWSGNALPTTTTSCDIGVGVNTTNINVATAQCLTARMISGGTLSYSATTNSLDVYGHLDVQSGFTFNAPYGGFAMRGSVNQSLKIETLFPGNLTINQGTAKTVSVDANSSISGNLTVQSGTLLINDGITLSVGGNVSLTGGTLDIAPGGTLKLADGRTLTVTSGTLKMIGTPSKTSKITSDSSTSKYEVVVTSGGVIQAQYYTFDHLGTNGLTIQSGASNIDSTYHLQNGSFTYPVANGTTFLRLYRKIPGDSLDGMSFDAAGSSATGITSVYTDASIAPASPPNLTISSYSGSWSGPGTENASSYLITWSGAVNTLDISSQAGDAGPSSVSAGSTYYMGRFRFKQTQSGSYSDTDIASIKLTLQGTIASSDLTQARIYLDATCSATSGGTLLGTGTFSGSPATVTFSAISGFTLAANPSNTEKCVFVEYDISASASNGATVGGKITAAADVSNSQSYAFSASAMPPVTLGTVATVSGSSLTNWLGTTNTSWSTATNWSAGVPDSTKNCEISNKTNKPVIAAGGTGTCKALTIYSGGMITLTDATSTLEVYGSYQNSGTLNQNSGSLKIRDAGTATTQNISSTTAIQSLDFSAKTGGGTAGTNGSFTVTNALNLPSGATFTFKVNNGNTLSLTNGLNVQGGTFEVAQGGILQIASGSSVQVNGGAFQISGVNDQYCANGFGGCDHDGQTLTNKGKVTTISGAGSWSFTANSGTVSLTGFLLDRLDASGLQILGSANLTALDGGQLTNLPRDWATPVKAIQLNTSAAINLTPTNVGWNWQNANSVYLAGTSPADTDNYYLVYASNCGGGTLNFDQWFGDFFIAMNQPLTSNKVLQSSCSVSIAASASPVSLTRLSAAGFDGEVSVEWETGSESDHAGFNLYRSLEPNSGYVQINPTLIRNISSPGSFHGVYRFRDRNVINDLTYYYYIEDISIQGIRKLHGPVSAIPAASRGSAPSASPGTNLGDSSSGSTPGASPSSGAIATPGLVDLGNGVRILSQTQNQLRIEVSVPTPTYTPSTWNGSYEMVSIPGYSSTLAAGKPELLERDILIEVDSARTLASVSRETLEERAISSHVIAPAPAWAMNPSSSQLEASWSADSAAYSQNSFTPASFYELAGAIEKITGKSYLRLKLRPLLWNPQSHQTRALSKITLDVALDGNAWAGSPGGAASALAPSAWPGAIRIRYHHSALYELSYEDLRAAGVEGPIDGANTSALRLYHQGVELPIEVVSATGQFSAGDIIRFYALFERGLEDTENEVVLLRFAAFGESDPPLRMNHSEGNPVGLPYSDEAGSLTRSVAEQDLTPIFDSPLGSGLDHFYWRRIYAAGGAAPTADSVLSSQIALPHLNREASAPVRFKILLRGRPGRDSKPIHHVGLYINEIPFMTSDAEFQLDYEPTELSFELPSAFFVPGMNAFRIQALGDRVSVGDWDIVDIDRVEVEYTAHRIAEEERATVSNRLLERSLSVSGFADAASVQVYDVTEPSSPLILDHVQAAGDEVIFGAREGSDGESGRRFILIGENHYERPSGLLLGRGYSTSLRAPSLGADLLVVGSPALLEAASELLDARARQGLRVFGARLDQIYDEFSHGEKSSDAIKNFILHAMANWVTPAPRYVLLLGDATYDPRNRLGYAPSPATMPIPLEKGQFLDFGSDHWFVTPIDRSGAPLASVGRIPTNSNEELRSFVRKLLDYESGARAPSGAAARTLSFVSDSDTLSEGFSKQSESLISTAQRARSSFLVSRVDRTALGSDSATRSAVLGAFEGGPLAVSYLGHGAEDRWADASVFTNSDASSLTNRRLPIVLALNCLNAYFYDADPGYQSLGEKMVLNPQGGAIAFWGSTTMTSPPSQIALARAFMDQLGRETLQSASEARLGDLLLRSKAAVSLDPGVRDTLRSYTLIGDPSMKLPQDAFEPRPAAPPSTPAAEPVAPPPAAQDSGSGEASSTDEDSGFFSCGTVSTGSQSGGPGSGSMPLAIEFGLLFLALMLARGKAPRHAPSETQIR